jgi:GxxExxY protein
MLLSEKGLKVQSQVEVPILFKGTVIENAFRLDLLVENLIIVELKAVENILPVHSQRSQKEF